MANNNSITTITYKLDDSPWLFSVELSGFMPLETNHSCYIVSSPVILLPSYTTKTTQ